jgi:dihydroxy-acid dehydratase
MNINRYSQTITQDKTQPAAQSMLYGIGLTEEDMHKAQVGIVSMGYDGNTCNMHLNDLAQTVKKSVWAEGQVGLIFNTIGVSDGISNGTDGMRFSLVSRDIIADSIETVCGAHYYDGLIAIPGCDKNMPGAIIAMGRLNRPSLMVYGGTIAPGCYKGQELNIVSSFEALGQRISGNMSEEDYQGIIRNACPGPGACGGMYTANTMAVAIEALGMSLPYSSSHPAVSQEKKAECNLAAGALKNLLMQNIRPSDIMTRKSFENAIRIVIAMGGSTNAVIHLIAMAASVGIRLSLTDFQYLSDITPVLADLKPSGNYLMQDIYMMGGTPIVIKYLLSKGLLHGDCLTVTGKTLAENISDVPDPDFSKQRVFYPVEKSVSLSGHLKILFGNLAPEGAVAKISGKEGSNFTGPARIFDGEKNLIDGILNGSVQKGDVVVIRYVGPKGGPGMPEMLKPTSAIIGAGLGPHVALITDGRFSGGSHGFVVGHITPEASDGGPIALIQDNDIITIDIQAQTIEAAVPHEIWAKRKNSWIAPKPSVSQGVLFKYMHTVQDASHGCITDQKLPDT